MIILKNISKKFGEHEILNNFSHEFEAGKAYGLVGASGSGKTTLLNIIGKLEKTDAGEILIAERKLKDFKEQLYFRDVVGYLFQNYGLIDNETIEQNLALAFVGKKIKKSEQKKIMIQTLEKENLAPDLKRKIYSLSGGEAQRVAIAKVMIKNPPLILVDEPTASLDTVNGKEVIELILGLLDKDKTIIIATHTPYVWGRMNELVNL